VKQSGEELFVVHNIIKETVKSGEVGNSLAFGVGVSKYFKNTIVWQRLHSRRSRSQTVNPRNQMNERRTSKVAVVCKTEELANDSSFVFIKLSSSFL
jgi:hypothetical protein